MHRKLAINANFLSYLLNIFDGKLSYSDIVSMPLARLTELQKIKEKELESRSKQIKQMQNQGEGQMTVNNNGRRFKDNSKNV